MKNRIIALAAALMMLCLCTAHAQVELTVEKMVYDCIPVAGMNVLGDIYMSYFQVGSKIYIQVYSDEDEETYALMDADDGSVYLEDLAWIGGFSLYSDLVYFEKDGQYLIYNLETNKEVCKLLNVYGLGYSGRFSEYGGFVTLAADEKLHFISNDGVIGNAVNVNQESYVDGYKRLAGDIYLGEGLYRLGVGSSIYNFKTIGIVNISGDVIAYVDSVDEFYNGGAVVTKGGKYGVIGTDGKYILSCTYDKITFSYSRGSYIAQKDGVFYEFDENCNKIGSFTPDYSLYDGADYLGNGLAKVRNEAINYQDRKYGLVNTNNEFILPLEYAYLFADVDLASGLSVVTVEKEYSAVGGEQLYCIVGNGEILVPFGTYDSILRFEDGMARVGKDSKYGFIDASCNLAIPIEYDDAGSFSDGKVSVGKGEEWFYINKNNEVVDVDTWVVGSDWKYSLTGDYNYDDDGWWIESYTGGIRVNATGQTVDISDLGLLPVILGDDGDCIIAYSQDFNQMFRLKIYGELNAVTVAVDGITEKIALKGEDMSGVIAVALYNKNNRLKEVKTYECSENINAAFDTLRSGDCIKVMWWESLKNFRPKCEVETVYNLTWMSPTY